MSIFIPQVNSDFSLSDVFMTIGSGVQGLEAQMLSQIEQLGNDPTPEQLATYQYLMMEWQTLLGLLTQVVKSEGDTQKQIAQNIGA
jgi:type III secretion apparatus needle protein